MRITFDLSAIKRTKWHEYLIRFSLGGAITLIAGLLAEHFGPEFGGMFLAFPAIFPASATLIEKHEREKKRRAGVTHTNRGREAAALDGLGAMMGCVGLAGFALAAWRGLRLVRFHAVIAIAAAIVVWLVISVGLWSWRKNR